MNTVSAAELADAGRRHPRNVPPGHNAAPNPQAGHTGRFTHRIVLAGFAPTDTRTTGTVSFDNVGLFGP